MISIITPSLNGALYITEAIESVLEQDHTDIEHIIVDGGSTDGTLDILKRYSHLRVISGADDGVYDAVNKGLHMARGEIIGWLNTDDLFEPNVFGAVVNCFSEDEEIDMVSGGARIFCEKCPGNRIVQYTFDPVHEIELFLPNLLLRAPIVNARFFRRRLYDRIGSYDSRYAIAADREFLLRVFFSRVRASGLGRIVYNYRRHERSLTLQATTATRAKWAIEHMDIAEDYLETLDLRPDERNALRQWHSCEASIAASESLLQLDLASTGRHVWRGWQRDLWWPLRCLYAIAMRTWRRLWRRG